MEKIIDDRWIGIEEAANYLGVNKDTIRNWIKKDTGIPAHRIGKLWKFKKSELDIWVKSGQSAIEQEDLMYGELHMAGYFTD